MGHERYSERTDLTNQGSKWKARLLRTLLAFGFYAGNLIINSILITVIHERVPADELPLPDILFDVLPFWSGAIRLVEVYMTFLMVMIILLVIFHRNGYRIAQRYCVTNGVAYWLRALCMCATSLSVPEGKWSRCAPKMAANVSTYGFVRTIIKRSLLYIPSLGSQSVSSENFCGDYLYSGHTINIVMGRFVTAPYTLCPTNVHFSNGQATAF